MQDISKVIEAVRSRIERQRGSPRLNEQSTKATLIEPVLRALGWVVEDVEEVQHEYKHRRQDKPVDYALIIARTPRLFVEAKALGENLDDRRWKNQIMGYATVAGVQWMVLTDGDEYRIYNTHAPVEVDSKLFRRVRLSEDAEVTAATLALLARDRLEENRIDVLWRAQFVDRQVEAALEDLFSHDNDLLLVNHVAGRAKDLSPEDVRASLRRCRHRFDFPVLIEVEPSPAPARTPAPNKGKPFPTSPPVAHTGTTGECSIADLLAAGLIASGAELRRKYKGQMLRAKVEPDGRVRLGKDVYASPSQAGAAALLALSGLRSNGKAPTANGWVFWRTTAPDGREVELDVLRKSYLDRAKKRDRA